VVLLLLKIVPVYGTGWAQFMLNAQHNGDTLEEELELPLSMNVLDWIKEGACRMSKEHLMNCIINHNSRKLYNF
jgi:hypothetical protein